MNRARMCSCVALVAVLTASAVGVGLLNQRQAGAQPAPEATAAPTGTFQIDPIHSSVIFKIKHARTTNFFGRFDSTHGSFTLGDTGSITVVVDANSVDTNNAQRDQHARSPDFLSVKEFPEINFTAKNLTKKSPTSYEGRGDLTFRGVTKPVDFVLNVTGNAAHGPMGPAPIAGVESTITIKRSDFGNDKMLNMLGDEVQLMVSFEGQLK